MSADPRTLDMADIAELIAEVETVCRLARRRLIEGIEIGESETTLARRALGADVPKASVTLYQATQALRARAV